MSYLHVRLVAATIVYYLSHGTVRHISLLPQLLIQPPSYVNNENLEILTRYSPLRDFNRFTPLKDCLSCFMISVDKGPLVLKILLSRVGYHKPAYRLQSKLIAIPTRSEVHISPICLVGRLSGVSLRIKHLVMNLVVITNLK